MNIEFNTTEDLEDKPAICINTNLSTMLRVSFEVRESIIRTHAVVIGIVKEKSKIKKRNVYRTY